MKKICIINHGLASGGTDAFVINILKNIDREKFTVDLFLAVNPDSDSQFREEEAKQYLNELSGNIYKIGDLGTASEKVNYVKNLYQAFKKNGPYDVVHSNMDLFNGVNLTIAKFAGIKSRISHSHNSDSQYEKETNRHFLVNLYRTAMKAMITFSSSKMLGCSTLALEYLYGRQYDNNQKCLLTYNGIDLSKFEDVKFSNENNIITVGAIRDVKNPFFIVEIINELYKLRSDFNFLWVGDGALKNEVKEKILEYGLDDKISMLGVRNDINQLLGKSALFLMPSFFEGLSIALVEAQASNLTCIVSDRITKEADCGMCEFLPLEKGAEYWAKVIDDYLSGRKCKKLDRELLSRFDEKKTIKELEDIYMS